MKKNASFIANSFWSLTTQIVRVGSLAAIMIALSRHFGPQRFGALAIGLAFVRIFAVLATFGLDRIVVRHLVDQTERCGAIIREAFRLKLAIAIVSYVAMLALIWTINRGDTLLLRIALFAGGGLFFQACDVYEYRFQAQSRFGLVFLGRSIPILISTALKAAAIFFNAPLLFFAVLETVEAGLIATALRFLNKWTYSEPEASSSPNKVPWTRMVAEGFPLLLSALAVMIYMRSDVVMLGRMIGYQAAGIYAAASQISEACALIPVAIMPALFPALLRWRRSGIAAYAQKFERLFLIAVLSGLAGSLTLTFGGRAFVNTIFGPEYSSAAAVLGIHGWILVFVFIGIAQSGYDVAENLTWFATVRASAGAFLNIALNLVLIPKFGVIGAAAATLCSQIVSAFLLNVLHSGTRPIFFMQMKAILIVPALRDFGGTSPLRAWPAWQSLSKGVKLADG